MLTYLRTMSRVLRMYCERRNLRLQSYRSYNLLRLIHWLLLLGRLQHLDVLLIGDILRLLVRLLLEYHWGLYRLIPHKLPLPSLHVKACRLLNLNLLLLNLWSTLLASIPLPKALPLQELSVRLRRSCTG